MCITCGCGHDSHHSHDHSHDHGHPHDHASHHGHTHHHDHARHDAHDHRHASGTPVSRRLTIEEDILAKNNAYARENRAFLAGRRVFALNLVSSPGSGKTSLLVQTIQLLKDRCTVCVIEGDQETDNDAARIRATGARAVQINTGKGCHLDAHQVGHAIQELDPPERSLLMIENVGNLVCPAAFDLGEAHKVVILSVTEGEDKPLKYPDMFRAADLMILNKCDLLPYVTFDPAKAIEAAQRVNPGIQVIQVSVTSGQGMDDWLSWLTATQR